MSTWAGVPAAGDAVDATGAEARFDHPSGFAVAADGSIYVADSWNHTIRRIDPSGRVSTVAGRPGISGRKDGPVDEALFNNPVGIVVAPSGVVYVADAFNALIRAILPTGQVTTLAGNSAGGDSDGLGSKASFRRPFGMAAAPNGDLLVADYFGARIRRITPSGAVTTIAGGLMGHADGSAGQALFRYPSDVAVDSSGNIFVADAGNAVIRRISTAGVVSTVAGKPGEYGYVDGSAAAARFQNPLGVSVAPDGTIYVADTSSNRIRRIATDGSVSTVAQIDSADGVSFSERFESPWDVQAISNDTVFVLDTGNGAVRRLKIGTGVQLVAGNVGSHADGAREVARFASPYGVAVTPSGDVFVADLWAHVVRKINSAGTVTTFAGTPGQAGYADGAAATARFNTPTSIAVDSSGNVYISDYGNHVVRKITPAGLVSTVAGKAGEKGSSDGASGVARLNEPLGIAASADGTLFVAEWGNHTVRRIAPDGSVTTLAGTAGTPGDSDGVGPSARFRTPEGVAVDREGNVFVGDFGNRTIRRITPAGVVTTVAGIAGKQGTTDGPAASATFSGPADVEFDAAGDLWIADQSGQVIRQLRRDGTVATIAGNGKAGYADGPALQAQFFSAGGLAPATDGRVFVADYVNRVVRIISFGTILTDAASVDVPTGAVGAARQLAATGTTATSWWWRFRRRPAQSLTSITAPRDRTFTFVPDSSGLYQFELRATDGASFSETQVSLLAACTKPPAPSIRRTSGSELTCPGTPVTVEAVGTADSFLWSNGAITRATVFAPDATSTISVVANVGGCASEPAAFTQNVIESVRKVTIPADAGEVKACANLLGTELRATFLGGTPDSLQWGFRTVSGGAITPLPGRNAASYEVDSKDFPQTGNYLLVLTATSCGVTVTSNESAVAVVACPPQGLATVRVEMCTPASEATFERCGLTLPAISGDRVLFRVSVSNDTGASFDGSLTLTMSSSLNFVRFQAMRDTTSLFRCNDARVGTARPIECTLPRLASGATTSLGVVVTTPEHVGDGAELALTARATVGGTTSINAGRVSLRRFASVLLPDIVPLPTPARRRAVRSGSSPADAWYHGTITNHDERDVDVVHCIGSAAGNRLDDCVAARLHAGEMLPVPQFGDGSGNRTLVVRYSPATAVIEVRGPRVDGLTEALVEGAESTLPTSPHPEDEATLFLFAREEAASVVVTYRVNGAAIASKTFALPPWGSSAIRVTDVFPGASLPKAGPPPALATFGIRAVSGNGIAAVVRIRDLVTGNFRFHHLVSGHSSGRFVSYVVPVRSAEPAVRLYADNILKGSPNQMGLQFLPTGRANMTCAPEQWYTVCGWLSDISGGNRSLAASEAMADDIFAIVPSLGTGSIRLSTTAEAVTYEGSESGGDMRLWASVDGVELPVLQWERAATTSLRCPGCFPGTDAYDQVLTTALLTPETTSRIWLHNTTPSEVRGKLTFSDPDGKLRKTVDVVIPAEGSIDIDVGASAGYAGVPVRVVLRLDGKDSYARAVMIEESSFRDGPRRYHPPVRVLRAVQ